jgi:hypothetical protein
MVMFGAVAPAAYVGRDPSRFVFGKQLGRRSTAGILFIIDIRQLLPGAVLHDEAGFQFIYRPGWREAACHERFLV